MVSTTRLRALELYELLQRLDALQIARHELDSQGDPIARSGVCVAVAELDLLIAELDDDIQAHRKALGMPPRRSSRLAKKTALPANRRA